MSERFAQVANRAATLAGNYLTFLAAVGLVVIWAVSGPFFGFSTTWQLVINTGTTIITFLMVFLIQNTQNRDSVALHLKIDELIRALEGTDEAVITAEEDSDEQMQTMKAEYHQLADEAVADVQQSLPATPPDTKSEADVDVRVASVQGGATVDSSTKRSTVSARVRKQTIETDSRKTSSEPK